MVARQRDRCHRADAHFPEAASAAASDREERRVIGLNRGQIYEFSGLFVPGADKNIVAAKTAIFGVLLPKCSRASAAFCEFSVGSPLTSRILSWGRPSRDNSPQPEPQVTGAPLTTNLSDEQL